MTEKEKLIARLNELGVLLGREVNTSGTIPELSMRIAELEEELDDETETGGVDPGGVSGGSVTTSTEQPTSPANGTLPAATDDTLVVVKTLVTLHIDAMHATRDECVPIAEVGSVIRLTEADATSLVSLGLVREQ